MTDAQCDAHQTGLVPGFLCLLTGCTPLYMQMECRPVPEPVTKRVCVDDRCTDMTSAEFDRVMRNAQ